MRALCKYRGPGLLVVLLFGLVTVWGVFDLPVPGSAVAGALDDDDDDEKDREKERRRTTPAQPRIFGKTYGDLAAEWWQWLRSIPRDGHPVDSEGEIDCSVNQRGPVWFLAGSRNRPNEPVVRSCVVPRNRALFFPLVTTMFFNGPGENFTVEEKRELLDEIRGTRGCNLECFVNGVPTAFSTPIARVQSRPFRFAARDDDVFRAPPGTVDEEAIADGFWVFLAPLPPGEHEVRFSGSFCNPETKLPFFTANVVYNLTVQ